MVRKSILPLTWDAPREFRERLGVRCMPRRTVLGLRRIPPRCHNSSAKAAHDQRERKKPKSCGVEFTSQRTTSSQEATTTVRASPPSTWATPPEEKSRFTSAISVGLTKARQRGGI
ncbi:MAG TPA: hypothetical protein VFV87_21660 [Pirellulaceae bacterium]|nr:hypothetical protein [Pirellulaceae bacterium]